MILRTSFPATLRTCAFGLLVGCGNGSFQPVSDITSVRILATQMSEPYAQPGDTVTLTTLAVDGRVNPAVPMTLYWIPLTCADPASDDYYACFAELAGRTTTSGGGGGGSTLPLTPGVDLTPYLPTGSTYQVTVPSDIITTHAIVPGATSAFGTVFVFNIACAGHVEILPLAAGDENPQAPPIGCFDASHNQLGPADYVTGFTEIFSYAPRNGVPVTNANPVIMDVTLAGAAVDPTAGITVGHCDASANTGCGDHDIDTVVNPASWELNPGDLGADGTPHHEEIWVDYYANGGSLGSNARLLYDAVLGKLPDPHVTYDAPQTPGEYTLWVVVHDNRDGVTWMVLPLHVT